MLKKLFVSMTIAMLALMSPITMAAEVEKFIVEVNPSSAVVNQSVDLTIKAVDANNNVIKDYNGTIGINIDPFEELDDAIIPGDWAYIFQPSDQWQVVFSKWLNVKVPGNFTISVSDYNNETLAWKTSFKVDQAWSNTSSQNTITFSSPVANGTETSATITVVGNAGVKNAKVEIMLNWAKVKDETSNQNGDFTSFLTSITPGQYTLSAQVKDINNTVIAQSADVKFTYQPWSLGEVESFDILPSKTLKQWQKATFVTRIWWDISSIEIVLRDEAGKEQNLPLDKMPDWSYQKQLLMDVAGIYTIDLTYSAGLTPKTQAWIANVSVIEWVWIKEVTYIVDPLDKTKLTVWWKPIWTVKNVLVQKGKDKAALDEWVLFTGPSFSMTAFDVSKESYYIRLFPADDAGKIIGEPSDFIMIEQVQGSAPVCRVQGIDVTTQKMWDQYFLTWQAAENAERYIVYRSDRPVNSLSDMQKVGETSDTRFPYPFDPQAQTEAYAYYSVVAICQDGSSLQLWATQKVKVGPMTNMLLVLLTSMMIFGIYRMRKVSN